MSRMSSSSIPEGVRRVTVSPSRALISARATGETQLILPARGSASSTPTMVMVNVSPRLSQ
ncbi:hypothetical protein CDEN61S_03531 [Castellaniella denitrificans]